MLGKKRRKFFLSLGKVKANGSITDIFPGGNPVVVKLTDTQTSSSHAQQRYSKKMQPI